MLTPEHIPANHNKFVFIILDLDLFNYVNKPVKVLVGDLKRERYHVLTVPNFFTTLYDASLSPNKNAPRNTVNGYSEGIIVAGEEINLI